MANTLSNTHRVLDRKIKELEEYSHLQITTDQITQNQ